MHRRAFGMASCCWLLTLAGCAEMEETAEDKATKPKLVGFWYWTWTSMKWGEFHIVTERKQDGTYERVTVLFPNEGEAESSEETGKWGVNLGRYVEKRTSADGEKFGVSERERRFVIKSLTAERMEIARERVGGTDQAERRVTENFEFPKKRVTPPEK